MLEESVSEPILANTCTEFPKSCATAYNQRLSVEHEECMRLG